MIPVHKPAQPAILTEKAKAWTDALLAAVRQHGGYTHIPSIERERLLKYYRHKEIQGALWGSSHHKCAYCETKIAGGYLQVDHFQPKSIYPHTTFAWENLLPACARCNLAKGDLDTLKEPIVNPSIEDPAHFFFFDIVRLRSRPDSGEPAKAARTLSCVDLNRLDLYEARSALLAQFSHFEDDLEIFLSAHPDPLPASKLKNLRRALDRMEAMGKPEKQHSAFCCDLMARSKWFQEARSRLRA